MALRATGWIPAYAGMTEGWRVVALWATGWIPAFAGMTVGGGVVALRATGWIPAFAGMTAVRVLIRRGLASRGWFLR